MQAKYILLVKYEAGLEIPAIAVKRPSSPRRIPEKT